MKSEGVNSLYAWGTDVAGAEPQAFDCDEGGDAYTVWVANGMYWTMVDVSFTVTVVVNGLEEVKRQSETW